MFEVIIRIIVFVIGSVLCIGIPVGLIVFFAFLIKGSKVERAGQMYVKTAKNLYKKINDSDFDDDLKGDSTE